MKMVLQDEWQMYYEMKFDDTYFLYEHIDQGIVQMSKKKQRACF